MFDQLENKEIVVNKKDDNDDDIDDEEDEVIIQEDLHKILMTLRHDLPSSQVFKHYVDVVDYDQFSIHELDKILEELDMVTLLKCVPLFKEIQVYLESVVLLVEKDLVKVRNQFEKEANVLLLEWHSLNEVEKEANVVKSSR
ncbi:hypothetical protein Tco_1475578 [Tanacetum coccineum]